MWKGSALADSLKATRKQVPGEVLAEVDGLACLLFAGYDPYFEGNEPPGRWQNLLHVPGRRENRPRTRINDANGAYED